MQMNRNQRSIENILTAGLLVFGLIAITLHQSDYFRMIPGGLGDPRFNNDILEHLFRWMAGRDTSLWSPGFFYPYPGALAFSDNHFGSIIVYASMRLLGSSPEIAFIGWYTLAPIINYLACYHALRKFDLGRGGSAVGAFIFAFSLPASAQFSHAQLGYRFAVPLAMLALERFKNGGRAADLSKLFIFLTIQFYCSIYLGYFLILLMAANSVADYVLHATKQERPSPLVHRAMKSAAREIFTKRAVGPLIVILGCLILLGLMFYPYFHYSKLYGFQRSSDVIRAMLPRPSSYLLSDSSRLWGALSAHISNMPLRWEHQLFFGASALLLALIGVQDKTSTHSRGALITLLLLVALTLQVHGHSIYALLERLPLANAIRAVARIGLVMLFPLAVMAGHGFDLLIHRSRRHALLRGTLGVLIVAFMAVEYSAYTVTGISLDDLNKRMSALEASLPHPLARDAIVYVPLSYSEPLYMTELDGMLLAQRVDRVTLNGYSGNSPNGYYDSAIQPCDVVNNRLAAYASFAKLPKAQFNDLVKRVVIAGSTTPCTPLAELPKHSHMTGRLADSIIKGLSVSAGNFTLVQGKLVSDFALENHSGNTVSSISDDGHPIRFSWRWVEVNATPGLNEGWDTRLDLTSDVTTGGTYRTQAVIATPEREGMYRLEISMVQETAVWFHDAGMSIATSSQLISVKRDGSVEVKASL